MPRKSRNSRRRRGVKVRGGGSTGLANVAGPGVTRISGSYSTTVSLSPSTLTGTFPQLLAGGSSPSSRLGVIGACFQLFRFTRVRLVLMTNFGATDAVLFFVPYGATLPSSFSMAAEYGTVGTWVFAGQTVPSVVDLMPSVLTKFQALRWYSTGGSIGPGAFGVALQSLAAATTITARIDYTVELAQPVDYGDEVPAQVGPPDDPEEKMPADVSTPASSLSPFSVPSVRPSADDGKFSSTPSSILAKGHWYDLRDP
jgi:hypothetical protein